MSAAKLPTATLLTEEAIIPLKKYKGRTVNEIISLDPNYLLWMEREVAFIRLAPSVLARLFDSLKLPSFYFRMSELKKHREELATLLKYDEFKGEILPSARYAIEMMDYFIATFAVKPEINLALTKE